MANEQLLSLNNYSSSGDLSEASEKTQESDTHLDQILGEALKLRAGMRLIAPSGAISRRNKTQIVKLLGLPSGRRWRIRWSPSRRQLEIGPLIGVLVSVCRPGRSPMGRSTGPCHMMGRLWERRAGLVVFFQLKDIDLEARQVRACYWQQGRWHWATFPLPAVVYNRISHRSVENSDAYQEFSDFLARRGGIIFNPHYLDKWSAHRLLYGSPRVNSALPASVLLESRDQLQRYLRLYSQVFLKPISGSQGRGIVMMQLASPGVIIKFAQSGIIKRYSDLSKLPEQYFSGDYLLQQGLRLMTRQSEPVDLRLLMQKNEHGRWKKTKSFARIGSRRGIVSNISQGGVAIPISNLLAGRSAVSRKRIMRQVTGVANAVCASFDKIPGEHWGELGIDIGVDQRGKVWLIEVNARPWKRAYVITGNREQMLKALVRPLEHAAYLTGLTPKEEEHDLAAGEA